MCLSSLAMRIKISNPNCYYFKKLSVLVQSQFRLSILCKCAYFKNVFLTIETDVWNIEVFLIPWYTHPVLKKKIFLHKNQSSRFCEQVSYGWDFTVYFTSIQLKSSLVAEGRGNHPISQHSANQRAPFPPRDSKMAVRREFLSTLTKVEMATKLR